MLQLLKFSKEYADMSIRRKRRFIREGNAMTARDTMEIISTSSLWKMLSVKERVEALTYAMNIAGIKFEDDEVDDLIGEVYAG